MSWDLTGKKVTGKYLKTFNISGTVVYSRVKFNGQVQNEVKLDTPIVVYGATRESVLMVTEDLFVA